FAATNVAGVYRRTAAGWEPDAALNKTLPHLNVRDMAWLGDELWIATSSGITIVTPAGVTNLAPAPSRGIPESPNGLLVRAGGEVWIGGFGGIGVRGRAGARFLSGD